MPIDIIETNTPCGQFITLEGGEGAGKSSCIAFIKDFFAARNIDLVSTREPGGTPLAETLRQLLLEQSSVDTSQDIENIDAYSELLMIYAARRQHVTQVIQPALALGKWVLSDRFSDASYAYQGYGRALPLELIDNLSTWVHGDCDPDKTLLLDVPVEVGFERVRRRQLDFLDRIESEQLGFFHRVRAGYLQQAKRYPDRVSVIDANQPLAQVTQQIQAILEKLLADVQCAPKSEQEQPQQVGHE